MYDRTDDPSNDQPPTPEEQAEARRFVRDNLGHDLAPLESWTVRAVPYDRRERTGVAPEHVGTERGALDRAAELRAVLDVDRSEVTVTDPTGQEVNPA